MLEQAQMQTEAAHDPKNDAGPEGGNLDSP